MAIVYNGTTLQKIIYDGVDLDRVYYNGTLVFAKPIVYNGGDGTSLFGSKTYTFAIKGTDGERVSPGGLAYANMNPLNGQATYDMALNTYKYGGGIFMTNKTFNISLFNTLTYRYTVNSHSYPNNYYIYTHVGLSTSPDHNASNYRLLGTQYNSNVGYTYSGQNTLTLNLTNAKAAGSEYYVFVYFHIGHEASYDNTLTFTINDIIFS